MRTLAAVFVVGLLIVALVGCQTTPETGIVTEAKPGKALKVGDSMPVFQFSAQSGKIVHSDRLMGDVTVLAVIESRDPKMCVIAGSIAELATKESDFYTDIKYINVTTAPEAMCDLRANIVEQCALFSRRVSGLCDEGGKIRRSLGTTKSHVYYVVGHDNKVTAIGSLGNMARLRKDIRSAVAAYETTLKGKYKGTY